MNLLRMSSDLGGVRLPATGHGPRPPILTLARRPHVSVVTVRAMLLRRVTRSQSVLAQRATRLTHSWNSYMSPCPSSGVKPRV
jgi:hypothetical protein